MIDASSDGGDRTGASDEDEPVASVEPATVSAPEPPRRKKWQNPALEGLPLLDDEDDDPPPKPAPKLAAAPAARKKPKKPSANEMERIIALAEANQPELLPPD